MSSEEPHVPARSTVRRRLGWSFVSGISGLVTSLASLLLVSHVVAPSEYGRAAVVIAAWGMLMTPITWCGGLVMRYGPVELETRRSLAVTIATRSVFSLPVLGLLGVIAPVWLAVHEDWPAPVVVLTVAWLVMSTMYDLMLWSATAAQAFRTISVANLIVKGAPLVVTSVAVIDPFFVSAELLLTAMLCGVVSAIVLFFIVLRPLLGVERPDKGLLRQMWRYSLPGLLGMPALGAIAWADPILLSRWASMSDVGQYQLAYPMITVCAVLGGSINAVFSPELVRARTVGDRDALERYMRRDRPRVALLMATVAFGGACFVGPIVRLLASDAYAGSAELVALLTVAGGFVLSLYTLHPLVTATDSVWSMQIATILQAITNLLLDVLLAPRYGATGIAIANIVAWATGFVVLSVMLRAVIRSPVSTVPAILLGGATVSLLLIAEAPMPVRVGCGSVLLVASLIGAIGFFRARARRAATAE